MECDTRDLWDSVVERYDRAQATHAATLATTTTEVLQDGGISFVLKIAAALRDKPKPQAEGGAPPEGAQRNPFLPPDPNLFVRHLSPTHSVVLNKYNVVPHHVIVITREFQRQENPLSAADFEAGWAVMAAMPRGALAYYNSGPASGASQPHKHLQVVPLPLLPAPVSEEHDPPLWPMLAAATRGATAWRDVVEPPSLPFVSFVARLDPASASGQALSGVYDKLMQRALAATAGSAVVQPAAAAGAPGGGGAMSYNLVMTPHFMMVVPRRRERDGPLSCNAMAFAGSFFVRSVEEVAYVRREGPLQVLARVGCARGVAG